LLFVESRTHKTAETRPLASLTLHWSAHVKAPAAIYFEPLPKTATGKIQKHVLRERAKMETPLSEEDDT